jgi:hypothetical protein
METKRQLEDYQLVNLLPFVSLPDKVSIVRLRTALRFKSPTVALARAGIFIHNGDEIWSFTPLPILTSVLETMLDPQLCRSCARPELEAAPGGRKVLSWLLRKHFERYLSRFTTLGLFVEGNPETPRAYFHGKDGKARTISYAARNGGEASRNVVVQRWGGRRPWFKNEGLGYHVLPLGGMWGVTLTPFYVFTGSNAKKPLSFAEQIARASRWNGRDVKTGIGHLTFWEDFLTSGAPIVDLRQDGVDNLLLGRSLLQLPRQPAI